MDSFTEHILARARERQKMLAQYGISHNNLEITTKKTNVNVSQEFSGVSQDCAKPVSYPVETKSDATRSDSPSTPKISKTDEGNVPKIVQETKKTVFVSNCQNVSPLHSKSVNIKRNDFDMEIKLKSSSENLQLQIEIQESDEVPSNIGKELVGNEVTRRETDGKAKHSDIDEVKVSKLSFVPKVNISEKMNNEVQNDQESTENRAKRGLKCLADLAQNINQWEDDIKIPKRTSPLRRSTKPPAPQPPGFNRPDLQKSSIKSNQLITKHKEKTDKDDKENSNKKPNDDSQTQFHLDTNLVKTLESQGFTRTTSNSHLIYKYNKDSNMNSSSSPVKSNTDSNKIGKDHQDGSSESLNANIKRIVAPTPGSPSKTRTAMIANKAQLFESTSSPSKTGKDPALLSVSERRALFEKNKGVVVPKAPLGMAVPIHAPKTPVPNVKGQPRRSPLKKNPAPKRPDEVAHFENTSLAAVITSSVPQASNIASKTAALLKEKSTISQASIESSIRQERQKEMDMLLNRFNKTKAQQERDVITEESDEDNCSEDTPMLQGPSHKIICEPASTSSPLRKSESSENPSKNKAISPKVAAVLEDVKRIKVSPAKSGKLYPNLSDIEAATETENEDQCGTSANNSSSGDTSFGSSNANNSFRREVIQAVTRNSSSSNKRSMTDESDLSDLLDDLDEYGNSDRSSSYIEDVSSGPSPPKQIRHNLKGAEISESFHFKKPVSERPGVTFATPLCENSRQSTELPSYVVDDGNVMPLQHTVSFYRRQQSQETKTTPKHVSTSSVVLNRKESTSRECEFVEEKLNELKDEVKKQEKIIAQTSQAINLCSCTQEFMGSTEQVEAERVLLIATHKRQVVNNEMQRLSVEKTLAPKGKDNSPLNEKGTLTISNIELPLKRDYVRALEATGGMGHHIVCLIKCCEKVVAAKLVSTIAQENKKPDFEVKVPGKYTLNDIYAGSMIIFEVYCLQAKEESLPHEVKYHIKKNSSKSTPKKSRHDNPLVRPISESPGGPTVVRSPSFAIMGFVVIPAQVTKKKVWTMNNVPPKSPLDGTVEMTIIYKPDIVVEHRGFLTVFEDISGFGAWHRRWYLLKGHLLAYWKYPDDEKKIPPIDTIDLRSCITEEVGPVSREICARLNTFLVELERDAYPTDADSLVTLCKGDKTILRHLFSADTKEERIEWCQNINAALKVIRALKDSQ